MAAIFVNVSPLLRRPLFRRARMFCGATLKDHLKDLHGKDIVTHLGTLPIQLMDPSLPPIANVYPLEGHVKTIHEHHYAKAVNPEFRFPAPGKLLEVCFFSKPFDMADGGKFQRENLDDHFVAWLMELHTRHTANTTAPTAETKADIAKFHTAFRTVPMKLNYRASRNDKTKAAYQNTEDDEKQAETGGSSVLSRGRTLAALQKQLGENGKAGSPSDIEIFLSTTKFASNDTKMTLANIRVHCRVLKRFGMAVMDQAAPSYKYSAMYYMDRNEEVFHRKTSNTLWQDSPRIVDAFQAALPDLDDLRAACENLHILNLRGQVTLKIGGRSVAECCRALVMYTKIPKYLTPRFPMYQAQLAEFASLKVVAARPPLPPPPPPPPCHLGGGSGL